MEGIGIKANHEATPPPNQDDGKSWEAFNTGFSEVQKILEENKVLIGEINHNQESKIPENLTRNVSLIKELNNNMNQVVGLYTDLSSSFVTFMDGESNDNMDTDMKEKGPPTAAVGQKRTRAT
ncbi:hypothetical protein GOP47_0005541 [Adiantum capillus-veneris]|uniref:Protein EARLY FLOWERING 4 domain-containing protein n=1 Tax=Adiantum capillus-veneris TaxID=13818 RepID=A0A9D4ZNC1_ADICA|nr:hypothetical protein GOP47_0005541 [Adiantum capillus-veneris]